MRRLDAGQARRAFLAATGLARPRPAGRVDVRHMRRVYADVGVVQIDPINVLARAHHQVAMTRLGPYDRDAFDNYVWRSGEVYEGWIHVDATGPTELWPLLAHRRARPPAWRAIRLVTERRPDYLQAVLEEVAERGPVRATDLLDPGDRLGSWGTRSMGRAALDYHHLRGDLAIAWRDGQMGAWFDLPERVIPKRWLDALVPEPEAAERSLLLRAVKAVGLGTAADLADHHRQHVPTARRLLAAMADEGVVVPVAVEGWRGPVYADPELVVPRQVTACALVNPFDPVMWNRPRVRRLWGLDYTVEIYVPAAQRRYGYYVLGFLLDEHLAGLVDLAHDRRSGRLVVAAAHDLRVLAAGRVAAALAEELQAWARWLGAGDVEVRRAGDLADRLSAALP